MKLGSFDTECSLSSLDQSLPYCKPLPHLTITQVVDQENCQLHFLKLLLVLTLAFTSIGKSYCKTSTL